LSAIESIKDRTAGAHTSVEDGMTDRFFEGSSFDLDDFRGILVAFFGLYQPLDAALAGRVEAAMADFDHLDRSRRLERDLRTLGMTDAELVALPTLPETALVTPETLPELLGCLYVIEGSSLGNRVLRRRIRSLLGVAELPAEAFFHDDPRETRERWTHFNDQFARHITDRKALESATHMARATFQMFETWLT
jgi:heme oxygenase